MFRLPSFCQNFQPFFYFVFIHLSTHSLTHSLARSLAPRVVHVSLARYTLATLYLLLNTVEIRYNEPLYNEVLGVTNDFLYPVIVKYKKKNLDFGSPLALRYIEDPL